MINRPPKIPIAVLISGRGSNMQAVVAATDDPEYPAQVVSVVSNTPDAGGLTWADERGLATQVVNHRDFRGDRARFDQALDAAIRDSGAEFVVLAGFMRLLTPEFVTSWSGRMVNIHPSLLPAFKGLDTHARCIAAGVRISGCTIHFVVPEMDAGPIIAQAAVPVLPGDSESALANRILATEHQIYPPAIAAVLDGDCALKGEEVIWKEGRSLQTPTPLFSPHIL